MKTSELLYKCYRFFKKPRTWCQNAYSKNARGESCYARDDHAVSHCSTGVFNRFLTESDDWTTKDNAFHYLIKILGIRKSIVMWNDEKDRKKTHVIQAFLKAARLAEKDEKSKSRNNKLVTK